MLALLRGRRRALSLVELLVAILIIGALVTLGYATWRNWRARTWQGVLESDVKTNITAWAREQANRPSPSQLDSLRLSPQIARQHEEVTPRTYFLALRHASTNQTCWGLIDPDHAQGTGVPSCGPFPTGYPQVGGGGLPPVASFTVGPQNSAAGATILLDASASTDPDGSITAYAFEMGDGTTTAPAPTAQASYSYWAPSTYTVVLRVTDNDGNTASATQALTIGLPSEGPGQSVLTVSPSQITVGQSATVTVTTRNSLGTPLAGRTVTLTATGGTGPSVTQPSGPTGMSGIAIGTVQGTGPGIITVGGSVDGQPGLPTATVEVLPAVATVLEVVSGGNQRARASSLVPSAIRVRLRSQTGGPIAGETITWAVTAGGGSVSAASSVTDAAGEATLAGWTLGAGGAQTLTASAGAVSVAIAATVQVPTSLVALTPLTQDMAFAPSGTPLPAGSYPRVELRDQDGQLISGATVTWTTAGTGGTSGNPTLAGSAAQLTGFDGQATIAGWTSPLSSSNRTGATITATVTSVTPVVFTFTRLTPTQLVWVPTETLLLTRTVPFANPGYFEVRNASNTPVPFAAFRCNSGASFLTVNGVNLSVTAIEAQTNAQGRWAVSSVTSSRFTNSGSSFQCFALSGSHGWNSPSTVVVNAPMRVPASIVRVSGRTVADTILQARGSTVTSGLRYRVLDQFGVPLDGVAVDQTKSTNSVRWVTATNFNTTDVTPRVSTNASGEIALTGAELSSSAGAGPFGLQLSVMPGIQPGTGGNFDFTGFSMSQAAVITPITAASLVVISGNNQRVASGATLGPIVLEVRNSAGAPLAGFPVTIGSPTSSGGGTGMAYTGSSPLTTGADGRVTVTGWRVATVTAAGQQNQGLPASVTLTLCTGTCSVSLQATIVTAAALIPLDTAIYDQAVPTPGSANSWTFASLVEPGQAPRPGGIRFRVLDDQGLPVSGIVVRGEAISLAGGCNALRNPAFDPAQRAGQREEISDENGLVTFTDWTASPNYTDEGCSTESRPFRIPTCSTTSCLRNLRLERRIAASRLVGITDMGNGQVRTGAFVVGQVGVQDQRNQPWAGLTVEWVNTVGPGTISFPGTSVTSGAGIAISPGWQIIVVPVGTAVQHSMLVRPVNPWGFPESALSSISSRVCSDPPGTGNVACF